jgi:two-component system sensor histidine kinase YesM
MVAFGYILELLLLSGLWFLVRRNLEARAKIYRAELAKKEAEFQTLQSRINPHFLYNTLDCIRIIAYTRDVPEIVTISSSMAKMFRYSRRKGKDGTALVADELDCIGNYAEILKIRYNNRFQIKKNVDERILSVRMIKFILQPLVENAFFHGLERKGGAGVLRITGYPEEGGDIIFKIFDTGKGIEKEKLEALYREFRGDASGENGFALININHRLKNAYGSGYGLRIESEYGAWCEVQVRIGRLPEPANPGGP